MIAESGRQDEVETMRRNYSEEVASLQHIMKGELNKDFWVGLAGRGSLFRNSLRGHGEREVVGEGAWGLGVLAHYWKNDERCVLLRLCGGLWLGGS